MNKRAFFLVIMVALILLIPIVFVSFVYIEVPRELRLIAKYYIFNTINETASPEAVAAIVWDYRGLDTIYETLVLYLAIVGGLAIFRVSKEVKIETQVGLTALAKTSTKIIALLIATTSAAIAFHGHLTPGGGFPGGSALAVSMMILVPVFSVSTMIKQGITSTRLVAIRGASLTAIGLVALLPIIRGLEIVTNQRFYPAFLLDLPVPISGSISLYNLFEFLAVASGFTAVTMYLSIPETHFKGEMNA
ncbi:MAG: Na(+)/H(+) antiporter subunit B [Desulfurococcaceae archaeon]